VADAAAAAIKLNSNWDGASGVHGTCHALCYPARSMACPPDREPDYADAIDRVPRCINHVALGTYRIPHV